MYPNEMDFLVHQEQYKDLLREIERERLIRTAGLQNSGTRKLNLSITNWFGARLVKWGLSMQSSPPVAPASCNPCC